VFEGGDIYSLFNQIDFLFSTASGTCIDALAKGINVGVLRVPGRILLNPVPDSISKVHWRICEDLGEALNWVAESKESSNKFDRSWGMQIKKSFYEPISRNATLGLLGWSKVP
jgi:hypothetical protein